MVGRHGRILLSGSPDGDSVRVLSDCIQLADNQTESWVTITRVVKFEDAFYGEVEITRKTLQQMVKNFQQNVYGQEVAIDVAHQPSDGAAGFIRELSIEAGKLRGRIEWTDYGVKAVRERGFKYLSADYTEDYRDPETNVKHGHLLLGAGLTTRPRVKRLDPISLSFDTEQPSAVTPRMRQLLSEEAHNTMNEFLKKLRDRLISLKLAEASIDSLLGSFEMAGKALGDDKAGLQALFDKFEESCTRLAESPQGQISIPAIQVGITPEKLDEILASREKKLAEDRADVVRKQAENIKLFSDTIAAAQGLSDETRKILSDAESLINATMTADQVKALAAQQLTLGHKIEANSKLASMGMRPGASGSVHISASDDGGVRKLQSDLDARLKLSDEYRRGTLKLTDKVDPFVDRVLSMFDGLQGDRLNAEIKQLAGGSMNTGDTSLPASYQRTVIREALSDLNVLQLVQTITDPSAQATTQIPYELRDTSAVLNNGIVFEGNGIPGASVKQLMDTAYILPKKLSMRLSNEVIHFTRASSINFDAYARNLESNARVMREMISALIANELQRSSDSYGAISVSNEVATSQINGTTNTVYTGNFPLVRPHQQYDLQGNAVGVASNPISVSLAGATLSAFNGSGNQAAGTYYRVVNYNQGHIQFVDQLGAPVNPANATACLVSYSHATNLVKFDLDLPANTNVEKHLNGLLRAIGGRKAYLTSDQFSNAGFLLMSPTLNDTCTNAESFAASQKRDGTAASEQGDLQTVKGVAAYGTNAPGIDLGDERILIGQAGLLGYNIAKPYVMGTPFEAVDEDGLPTGEKIAYGEEYSAIKMPEPVRRRMTSVLAYSATGRTFTSI